ncbi:carboxymuconolactone decarboxylase family protein [Streptomyces sp. NPDC048718]|uniref:carboxymuconolactone decarboxylase family protein n=1 Tax=Streptomyces sp. NPDC048718 TaxID=3365587 RepID=UPI0037119AF4
MTTTAPHSSHGADEVPGAQGVQETQEAQGSQGAEQAGYAPEEPARLAFIKLHPGFYQAMRSLEAAASEHVDPVLYDLIKLRASQINHCAFCVDKHSKDALAAGQSVERLIQLSAWRESRHFYTERELAALALTEAVTVLTDGFVPDAVYEEAARHFDDTELAHVIGAITAINAWNRIAVTSRMVPGHYHPGGAKR